MCHNIINNENTKELKINKTHSSFSTLRVFHTPRFPHSPFSTLLIFHTPHFPHSALRTPHNPPNPPRVVLITEVDKSRLFSLLDLNSCSDAERTQTKAGASLACLFFSLLFNHAELHRLQIHSGPSHNGHLEWLLYRGGYYGEVGM